MANNSIAAEESLLGVLRFPALKQLHLRENPIVNTNRRTTSKKMALLRKLLVVDLPSADGAARGKSAAAAAERPLVKINSAAPNRKVRMDM